MKVIHVHHFPNVTNFPWQLFLDGDRWALVSEGGDKATLINGPYTCEPETPEAVAPRHVLDAVNRIAA